ncbi:TonB-dependent receptor [Kozakia baliensis]|uniref:hypothetical protein n=1 Tax=Kozakia baliensis TaxID=153496 RepID=UPI00345B631C
MYPHRAACNATKAWNSAPLVRSSKTGTSSQPTPSTIAAPQERIQYGPKNAATLWSIYSFAPHDRPYNLTFGGNITWRESIWLDATNTTHVPGNIEFDAVISHNITKRWKIALHDDNLDNRLNYDNLFSNRITPSISRSFLFNLSATD